MRRELSPKVVEHLKASGPSAWMCAPASGACTPEQIELGTALSLLMHAEIKSYLEGLAEWLLDRATTVWRSNDLRALAQLARSTQQSVQVIDWMVAEEGLESPTRGDAVVLLRALAVTQNVTHDVSTCHRR